MGATASIGGGSTHAEPTAASRRRLRPPPGEVVLRLACFPHAGGGPSAFNGWRRYLPAAIGLVPLTLPGRNDHRRRPCIDVRGYVDELLEALGPLADRPLALYGHSLGAIVAFELARALRRAGRREPAILFVSGRRAPDRPLRELMLCGLPDGELMRQVGLMGGTAARLLSKPRWRRHFLTNLRSELEISDRYHYEDAPPLACPIVAFLGIHDPVISRVDWQAWRGHTTARFVSHLIPGRHIFTPAEQQGLVGHIVDYLQQEVGGLADASAAAP